jgi:hypothetical protein
MRKLAIVAWLVLPVVAWAYHRGPGQERLLLDDVDHLLQEADQYAADENWADAEKTYDAALAALPGDRAADSRRIRLARARAQVLNHRLPFAHDDLKQLLDEALGDEGTDPALLADIRAALANSQYYMTWLMRLEGEPESVWGPEIEASRQAFRLLAEQAETAGDDEALARHREDLESAIRLARMDLHDLQGLPLPSQ